MATKAELPKTPSLEPLIAGLGAHDAAVAITAIDDAGGATTVTYGELAHDCAGWAALFKARGIAPGQRIALFGPPSPGWIGAALGVIAAGAILVPIDDDADDRALADQLTRAEATALLTAPQHAARLGPAIDAVPVIALDAARDQPPHAPSAMPGRGRDDIAIIFFTSGTTGPPKGVPLSHGNLSANLEMLLALGLIGPGAHVLNPLPLYHAYPFLVGMLVPLAAGAGIVLPADVTGPALLTAIRTGTADVMIGVPRLFDALATGITGQIAARGRLAGAFLLGINTLCARLPPPMGTRAARLLFGALHRRIGPRLHLLVSGGAKLNAATEARLKGFGWQVLSGYGLVETASVSIFNPPGRARAGSAGRPGPDVELRIADADTDGIGEVLLRGPNLFAGYWRDPAATAAAIDQAGWFHTGDCGRIDRAGYLYITGRAKELIVLAGGKNVTPETVEAHYAARPEIAEIAVLERDGKLVALVVPDEAALRAAGARRLAGAIRIALAEVAAGLPSHLRLAGYAISRAPLPRTRLGKYRRHLLPALYDAALRGKTVEPEQWGAADRALIATPAAREIWAWLERRFAPRAIVPATSPQLDLGLDSLGWVELALEIERRFGVRLSEEQFGEILTLGDLLRAIETTPKLDPATTTTQPAPSVPPPPSLPYRLLANIIYAFLWITARLLFRLRVEGADRVPKTGPLIIAANHASDIDAFVLAAAMPRKIAASIYWSGDRARVFSTRPRRALARAGKVIAVDEAAPAAGLATAKEILARRGTVMWFPEAWRSPDGALQDFLPGIGHLAEQTGAPILPAYIAGTFEALPRHRAVPRLVRLNVRFGNAHTPGELERLGAGDTREARIASGLRAVIGDLAEPKAS